MHDSLDSFRTAVGLHRARIAQETEQHISRLLSMQHIQTPARSATAAEPVQPCARLASFEMTAKRQHLRNTLASVAAGHSRVPAMDVAAIAWWSTAARRCLAPRDQGAANAHTVPPRVETSVTDAKALDERAAALADAQRCRRGLHRLRTSSEVLDRATLVAPCTLGLLRLRRACDVWRSHRQLTAAPHAAANELHARARTEHRRLGCRRGLDEMLRFAWRARHMASMAGLRRVLQRRRVDRELGRALRRWRRTTIASVSARDCLRGECGQRKHDVALLPPSPHVAPRPPRPPLAALVPTHNVPVVKKAKPGPRRQVKKTAAPCTPSHQIPILAKSILRV